MQINNTNNTPNFKARVEIVNPQNLIRALELYPDITLKARLAQSMCDTITLANTTAPLVGGEKDVIKLDFGGIKQSLYDDFVNVEYNNQNAGLLTGENPFANFSDIIENLTNGIITRADSRAQLENWGSFGIQENGQIQRMLYGAKAKVIDTETTTMEKLTEKLKKLLGLN